MKRIQIKIVNSFIFIISMILLVACNIQKKLPEDTKLYAGATYKIEKIDNSITSVRKIKSQLEEITIPIRNKMFFGFPYKVWFWYAIGEPKREKGLRYWLRSKIGEPPVLSVAINAPSTAKIFESYLQNKGYFKTKASGDTTIKGYKLKANYKVKLGNPYFINDVKWVLDTTENIAKDIKTLPENGTYLKKNKQYDLDNIKAERDRTDIHLKKFGYYFFTPDYVTALVDSTLGNEKVNIFLKLKNNIPQSAKNIQTIKRIIMFPNYTLLIPPPDTNKSVMEKVDNILIRDTIKDIKHSALTRSVTYRPGEVYNIEDQNKTLNRLINLGVYKFVKNRYATDKDTINPHALNVYYYLTPLKKKNVNTEIGAFTKSNSYTGGQLNLNFRNRNTLKGAEQLAAKVYTSFEVGLSDSLQKNNNFRVGGEVSLTFPRFVVPFKLKENNYFPPRTRFLVGYEWLRRQQLFSKNFLRFQYDITWKETSNKEHTLGPLSITYNNVANQSPEYLQQVTLLPSLKFVNLPEVLIGGFYNFTYNTTNPNAQDIVYFNGNVDFVGNLIGLFSKAESPFTKKIAGAYYAQYIKLDFDARYTRKLNKSTYWANRLTVGFGNPYGNSAYLPFSRQFIIGGSNSLRGFRPRQLGPGRVKTTPVQQVYLPQLGGDYKLEMNSELRLTITKNLKSAIFVDVGNIWMKNVNVFDEGSQLTKNFVKDIAVDAGFGLRYDISLLLLRFDLAIPLRNPTNEFGQEWIINQIAPLDKTWRKSNLIFSIGFGYPF